MSYTLRRFSKVFVHTLLFSAELYCIRNFRAHVAVNSGSVIDVSVIMRIEFTSGSSSFSEGRVRRAADVTDTVAFYAVVRSYAIPNVVSKCRTCYIVCGFNFYRNIISKKCSCTGFRCIRFSYVSLVSQYIFLQHGCFSDSFQEHSVRRTHYKHW